MAGQSAGRGLFDLRLDPLHPPKYCPQCAWNAVKSRVRKFKVDPTSQDVVIMCRNDKCPWPFSVTSSPSEATVRDDDQLPPLQESGVGAGCQNRRRKHDVTHENSTEADQDDPSLQNAKVSNNDTSLLTPGTSIIDLASLPHRTESVRSVSDQDAEDGRHSLGSSSEIKSEILKPRVAQFENSCQAEESATMNEDTAPKSVSKSEVFVERVLEINNNTVSEESFSSSEADSKIEENSGSEFDIEKLDFEPEEKFDVDIVAVITNPDFLTPLLLTPQTPHPVSDQIPEDVDQLSVDNSKPMTGEKLGEEVSPSFSSLIVGHTERFKQKNRRGRPRKLEKKGRRRPPKLCPGNQRRSQSSSSLHPDLVQNQKFLHNTPGLVTPTFLVRVDQLPPGVVPCAPPLNGPLSPAQLKVSQPFHSRMISVPSSSPEHILRLAASPRSLSAFPSSFSLVEVVTSDETARSLFDMDETGANDVTEIIEVREALVDARTDKKLVYLGSIKARDNTTDTIDQFNEVIVDETVKTVKPVKPVKPVRTFTRVPRQANSNNTSTTLSSLSNQLYLQTGLDIEAEVLPYENCFSLSNLTRSALEMDDDFATVRKLGTGLSLERELGEMIFDETIEETVYSFPQEEKGNTVVFHVANQTMTTQPSVLDNYEVKEQGSTRVLLTASSDQVELADLKRESVKYNFKPDRRGRGRPPGSCRGGPKRRGKRGRGWFLWKDWRVDGQFIVGFSDYLKKLVSKWDLPKNLKIDDRIQALLKEREVETDDHEEIQHKISFFAAVFVKYLYIQTNFPSLSMDKLMNILQKHHVLENKQFAEKMCSLKLKQPPDITDLIHRLTQTGLNRKSTPSNQCNPKQSSDSLPFCPTPPKPHPSVLISPPVAVQPEVPTRTTATDNITSTYMFDLEDSTVNTTTPSSLPPYSVYNDSSCSVQVTTASPTSSLEAVGEGTKQVQFFYSNQEAGTMMVFPPVQISTDEEVSYVVALVTEKAEEYNRRNNVKGRVKPQIQYSTEAAMARSVLDEKVVRHIKTCFTKKGMKELRPGRRKWTKNWAKRKDIVKVTKHKTVIKEDMEEIVDEEVVEKISNEEVEENPIEEKVEENPNEDVEENPNEDVEENLNEDAEENLNEDAEENPNEEVEEETDKEFIEESINESVKEHVPTAEEIKLPLELQLFGGYLPKIVCRIKPPREGASDRTGRGGRNEFDKNIVPESLILGAVEYMLACKNRGDQEQLPKPTISLSALFRKRRSRRKRINIDFDDLSDDEDEDYKAPSIYNRKADRPDEKNKRKSNRLCEQQTRVDSGEYFDAENHNFFDNQENRFVNTQGFFLQATQPARYSLSQSSTHGGSDISPTVLSSQSLTLQELSQGSSEMTSNPTNVGEWTALRSIANVNENYLRNSKKSAKVGLLDQVFARNMQSRKVIKIIKKYKGFGGKGTEQKLKRRNLKKKKTVTRKVSKEEKDLMKELLDYGEAACAAANSNTDVSQCSSIYSPSSSEVIKEFEEHQTFALDNDSDDASDFQTLFKLNLLK